MRATSKRLCFIASMARSNRTLSGCFESTFAIGLLTFLFVQATVTKSTPQRKISGIRRDIKTSNPRTELRDSQQAEAYPFCNVASVAAFHNFAAFLLGS